MKRILILLLFLALPVAATAQQTTVAAPDVSLTANNGNANLYNGWPLLVNVTIMNSTALSLSPTPLLIAPPNGVWTDAIQFTVTSASGQPVQWPLKLVGTPEDPTLTLTQNDYVRVSFQASATDVATFAPGDYQLSASIQVTGSNGWNGTVSTVPVTITVGPEPTLTPDLQAQKTILLAGFAVNSGDDITAITLTQQLQQAQPDNPTAAIIAADTLSYAGYPALALTEGGEALATFYRINPNAPEPPTDLLTEQQFLFGLFATPDAEVPTLTAITSPSLIFSPAAQTTRLSATITAASSVEGGTVTFTVANIGTATSGPVAGGVASSPLTVPGGTHPGSYQIQAAYSGTTAFASSSGAGTLTIGRATPLITWNNPSDIAAGTALGTAQLNATANVPGVFIYSPPAGTVLTAGAAQALAVAFTPTDVVDYNSASASVSINVTQTQGHLTITANSASRQYGQANPAFTASFSGFTNGDTASVLSGVLSCTSSATPLSAVSGSPYPVTCSGLTSNKYTISYVPGTLTISPAPLTATANNSSVQYGKPIQLSGVSYSGFVNGDTATSLAGTLNCVSSATQASSVGTYAITCSGVSSTNYAISFVQGLLTITPAPLTIKANDASRAVGAANPPLNNVTATGFVNNDKLSSLAGTLTCTTVATTTSPAGSYSIVCTGLSSTNYAITYLPGTLQITSNTLTVTATSVARQYGSANPTFAATFAGFTNGDTAASLGGQLTCTTNATSASSVSGGPYPINCAGLASTKYAITYVPGTLIISPAPLVVAANDASRPYGANNPPLTGTITGLLNADSLAATFSTQATPASSVGTYPIQPVIAALPSVLSNYTISPIAALLNVVPEKTSLAMTVVPGSIGVNQPSTITITLTAPDMVIPIAPSVLAAVTVDSPVSTDILTNNGACTPIAGETPGVASCAITITALEPNGRTLSANFPGTAALTASTASANLMVTTPVTGTKSCIVSDFRNVPVRGGDYLWFNSIFRVRHVRREMITLSFSQASVDFKYRGAGGKIISVHQPVPDARIIIDPKARTASTKFDSAKNIWITTVPFDRDDDVFLSGTPWQVPSGGIPGNIEPVTWCGTFSSDETGVDVGWRWAAAAYRQFSNQNNALGVRVADDNHRDRRREEDRAGTPENFKRFIIPGARGFGGRNYTGTYTRGKEVD